MNNVFLVRDLSDGSFLGEGLRENRFPKCWPTKARARMAIQRQRPFDLSKPEWAAKFEIVEFQMQELGSWPALSPTAK